MEVIRMQSYIPASALMRLAGLLEGCDVPWVVGGSTGLALRGARLERAPRDLDVYLDKESVSLVHDRLKAYALDEPESNATERYRSILSHYRLEDTLVELVGDFRVSALQSVYSTEVGDFLFPFSDKVQLDGHEIPLVPLAHELIFNMLRERKDRALLAGELIHLQSDLHLPILLALLRRNRVSRDVAEDALRIAHAHTNDGVIEREER
jgi:hypothetical protein